MQSRDSKRDKKRYYFQGKVKKFTFLFGNAVNKPYICSVKNEKPLKTAADRINTGIKVMTFEQMIYEQSGYECKTTFWMDFSIADRFGIAAVKDTFNRAFAEWKNNYEYLCELVLVLNHKIWQKYQSNKALAAVYDELWRKADEYTVALTENDEEKARYYFEVLD